MSGATDGAVNGAVSGAGNGAVGGAGNGARSGPRPPGRLARAGDEGFATVLAAAAVGVLVCLLGLALALGAATLARHRAEAAADLGALAAARDVVTGADVACARAAEVVRGNGALLVACSVDGWTVTVVTSVPCGCVPSVSGDAAGRARAGPVAAPGTPVGAAAVTAGDRPSRGPGRAEGGPG